MKWKLLNELNLIEKQQKFGQMMNRKEESFERGLIVYEIRITIMIWTMMMAENNDFDKSVSPLCVKQIGKQINTRCASYLPSTGGKSRLSYRVFVSRWSRTSLSDFPLPNLRKKATRVNINDMTKCVIELFSPLRGCMTLKSPLGNFMFVFFHVNRLDRYYLPIPRIVYQQVPQNALGNWFIGSQPIFHFQRNVNFRINCK